jgi:hydrogenase assembly chaperone HypC/HupF
MCLGIPAQLVDGDTGHPDLAMAEVGGVRRTINIGLLDEPPQVGDWVLVHMGFALQVMSQDEAREALAALGAEQEAQQEAEHEAQQEAELEARQEAEYEARHQAWQKAQLEAARQAAGEIG